MTDAQRYLFKLGVAFAVAWVLFGHDLHDGSRGCSVVVWEPQAP